MQCDTASLRQGWMRVCRCTGSRTLRGTRIHVPLGDTTRKSTPSTTTLPTPSPPTSLADADEVEVWGVITYALHKLSAPAWKQRRRKPSFLLRRRVFGCVRRGLRAVCWGVGNIVVLQTS